MENDERSLVAAKAVRAAVHFADEVFSIVNLSGRLPISLLNRTVTISNLERGIEDMQAFVKMLRDNSVR